MSKCNGRLSWTAMNGVMSAKDPNAIFYFGFGIKFDVFTKTIPKARMQVCSACQA